jgi:hypothetical protein
MSAAGNWKLEIPANKGRYDLVLVEAGGGVLTGTMASQGAKPSAIHDGREDGNKVGWKFAIKTAEFTGTAAFAGTVDGVTMTGNVSIAGVRPPFNATRA